MPNDVSIQEAAVLLRQCNRVLVIGASASGKSTLSRSIARKFNLQHLSLDREVFWQPGWTLRDKSQQREIIAQLVAQNRWVMDGTGHSSFDLRLPRTDLLIWVRLPRHVAFYGLFRRWLQFRGQSRPDVADGCPEQFPDLEFLSYIWNFERDDVPKCMEGIDAHGPNVPALTLPSYGQMRMLLDLAETAK